MLVPYTLIRASTRGAPEFCKVLAPAAPAPKNKMSIANAVKMSIAPIKPRGRDLAGSFASSAANGTPSTARKNQIAKGTAAQMPK